MHLKAMILGAGRIGRGFVSELLHANQVEITYFDASSAVSYTHLTLPTIRLV